MVQKYKCYNCFTFFYDKDMLEDGECPNCKTKNKVVKTCEKDSECHCITSVTSGVTYCDVCGQPICPCGGHTVMVLSRVTGYIQPVKVNGEPTWNAGKVAEFENRVRYDMFGNPSVT